MQTQQPTISSLTFQEIFTLSKMCLFSYITFVKNASFFIRTIFSRQLHAPTISPRIFLI